MKKGLAFKANEKKFPPSVFAILKRKARAIFVCALEDKNIKKRARKNFSGKIKLRPANFLAAAYFIFVFGGFLWLYHSLQAEESRVGTIEFYASTAAVNSTSTADSGWQNKNEILGEPEAGRFGDSESFTASNSAVFYGGTQALIAGDFITLDYLSLAEENIAATTEAESASSSEEISTPEENISTEETGASSEAASTSSLEAEIPPNASGSSTEELLENHLPLSISDSPAIEAEEKNNSAEELKTEEEVSFSSQVKEIISLGKKTISASFSGWPALAQWGSEADDRNQIYGEFKDAKIKFSLAIKDRVAENNSAQEPEEEAAPAEGLAEEEAPLPPAEENNPAVPLAEPETNGEQENISAPAGNQAEENPPAAALEENNPPAENSQPEDNNSQAGDKIEAENNSESGGQEPGFLEKVLEAIIPSASGAENQKPQIALLYSLNNGAWQEAGAIDSIAAFNAQNGDYFSLPAPFLNDWQDLDDLRLKLEVRGENQEKYFIYLDSVWIEADYKIAKDENDPEAENSDKNILRLDGQEISFDYTDENSNENLIIRTNSRNYYDLNSSNIYFSVENIGARAENFDIHFYFPEDRGRAGKLEKLNKRQPFVSEEAELGPEINRCDNGWEKREEIYSCYPTGEEKKCDSVSPNKRYCRIEQAVLKKNKKIKYRNAWEDVRLSENFSAVKNSFFKKLLGLSPVNKPVPEEFKPKNTTDEEGEIIAPGEVQYFRAQINFPFGSSGEFYIEAVGNKEGYGLLDPWWNAAWDYERPINISYSGSALTDYQAVLQIDTAALISAGKMQNDCDDIRFADSNKWSSGQLSYWLEPGTCNTEKTRIWVKVPAISASKTIYLYYGNSSAAAGESGANTFVYFNDFETAVGFNEGNLNPARTAGSARSGSYGLEADGATNFRQQWRDGISSGQDLIWETWVREDSSSASTSLAGLAVGHTDGGANNLGYQAVIRTNDPYLELRKNYSEAVLCSDNSTAALEDSWYFLRLSWESNNEVGAYLFNSPASSSPVLYCTTTDATYTAGEYGVADYQAADFDEYRVRKFATSVPALSAGAEVSIVNHAPANPSSLAQYNVSTSTAISNGGWMTQDTINLYATSTDKDNNKLYTYFELIGNGSSFTTATSIPETFCDQDTAYNSCSGKIWSNATTTEWLAGDYGYRIPITIQASQVKGALTNFPAYFDLAKLGVSSDFWSHTKKNSDGGDLVITSSDGLTRAALEVAYISTSTKQGEIYFLADSISSSSNITFYLYYGSSTAAQPASTTATIGSQNVWSEYAGIWHLKETGLDGSAGQIKDSSANYNNGTASPPSPYTGPASVSTGKIYNAVDFTGGDSADKDYIDLYNPASLQLTNNFSFGGWAKGETVIYGGILGKISYNDGTYRGWGISRNASGYYRVVLGINTATPQLIQSNVAYTDDGWHYIVGSITNGTTKLYVDGVVQDASNTNIPTESGLAARIGSQYPDMNARYWDGVLDEMRVTNVVRSAKWIETEYNNQNNPAAFFATSTEEASSDPHLLAIDKPARITSVPDSAVGYKWQVLICDAKSVCSDWVKFNDTTPNFKVDTIAPTAPGALSPLASTTSSIKLQFGATSTEANFSEYRIYYRLGSTTAPTENDSLFSSSSDANLASQTFNGKSSTTVSGLAADTWYSFAIFAYDQSGQKASSSYVSERTDRLPTGSFSAAAQKTDGSGAIDVAILADDPDDDTQLRAKLEYVLGAACDFSSPLDPTLDAADAKATSTYGDAKIDNGAEFQIGTSAGWIIASSGANLINFDWFSKTDIGNASGTYCLRLTVDDNRGGQSIYATTTVEIDNIPPTAPSALTAGETSWTTAYLVLATSTPSSDDHEPAVNAYRIFYKAGASGVRETDSEQDDVHLNFYDYSNATSVLAVNLSTSTAYVFNIWAYDSFGNKASATQEMTLTTDTHLVNKNLDFVNAKTSGASVNVAVADEETEWNFRATVNNGSGWQALDKVVLRLANRADNSAPFEDLMFSWDQASNVFSETGADASSMAAISSNSSSACSGFSCALDFKIIFNENFATSGVDYAAQVYSTDDAARSDEDLYSDIYRGLIIWINQIHYRWRNDDGGG